MTLDQILSVLRARWRSAALVFALVLAAVAAFTLYLPQKFTAAASVLLDVKSPDPIAGVVLPGMNASGYMSTQVDVLLSERVVSGALQALRVDDDPALKAEWQRRTEGRGEFHAWLAEEVTKRLDVKPGKDSNVIMVSFTAPNAVVASNTVNAVVKSYIDTTLQLRTEPAKEFRGMFDESTKALRAALEIAQSRFSAFQQSKGIVATDEKLDIENSRLAELSSQLVALQGVSSESDGRQREAALKSDQMQEVLGNPMIQTLSADLARQQARLNELTQRLGDEHPQVRELRANITELRGRLNAEKARIAGGITVSNSVNQSRLDALRTALAAQRSRVLEMKGLRDEAAVLQRDVENAQRVYDAEFTRLNQSVLESKATQTNVSVLKKAAPPPYPSSPKLSLNLLVGLLMGIVLACATALVRERRDWRLRADADVFDVLKQPLLGVLPDRARSATVRRPLSLRTVAGRLLSPPAPVIGR